MGRYRTGFSYALVAGAVLCACLAGHGARAADPCADVSATPLRAPFVHPVHEERYAQRLALIDNLMGSADFKTLALGDSIVQRWPNELLTQMLGGPVLNAGVGGDMVPNLLWRLDHFERDIEVNVAPSTIFLLIGSNDLARGAESCAVADGIGEVLEKLKELWPQASFVVGGILPRGGETAVPQTDVDQVNEALAARSDAGGYTFVPFGAPFLTGCETIDDCALYTRRRGVHPTIEGYELIRDEVGDLR